MPINSSVTESIIGTSNTRNIDNSINLDTSTHNTWNNINLDGVLLRRIPSSLSLRSDKTIELMGAAERELLKARRSKILGLIESTTDILLQSKAYQDSALHLVELLVYLKCDPIVVEGLQETLTTYRDDLVHLENRVKYRKFFDRWLLRDGELRQYAIDHRRQTENLYLSVKGLSDTTRNDNIKKKNGQRKQQQEDDDKTLCDVDL